MVVCPKCGQENPAEARFCFACATPLVPAAERRKLATVLFCDIAGSTALGERVDAEVAREIMRAYFAAMASAIEDHGGTVEKFVGDAVMAVFGVPVAHENDALRAVRAAWQMRGALESLNDGLRDRYGIELALRIGINTGEVVAGEASSRQEVVTGDAVNVAARLEQSAMANQIVIGPTTARLVRGTVSLETLDALNLKGKSEAIVAYRVESVSSAMADGPRHFAGFMVGRQRELERLEVELRNAADIHPSLITIVGEPGVGKSRLAAEVLTAAADRYRVLASRCLPYGEGITYWPLAEIVRQAARIGDDHSRADALALLQSICGPAEAQIVGQAIGLVDGLASKEAIASAFVALFRSLAEARPLLLFIDDIQWAEGVLLDFLRDLPLALAPAPVGVLCLGRPELVEDRPDWPVTVRLESLSSVESSEFVDQMLGQGEIPPEITRRIATSAAGNPLFLEELVGMLLDDGLLTRDDGRWRLAGDLAALTIPTTLRELLGARLDRLPSGERAALERGSVEGQVFHGGAVLALTDIGASASVLPSLHGLEKRDVVWSDDPNFAGETAFRFRHVLIRDAAYDAMPKRLRSLLHERFAGWLEIKAGDRTAEYDEILGYHLEQSIQYRAQLGGVSDADLPVAGRAAGHLTAAGRRAFARRDAGATVNLFTRSVALLPADDPRRLELLGATSLMLIEGNEFARARSILAALIEDATNLADPGTAAQARLLQMLARFCTEPDFGPGGMRAELETITPAIENLDDQRVQARIHDARAFVYDQLREFGSVEREAQLALECARRANDRPLESEMYWWLLWSLPRGVRPAKEALKRCHQLLADISDDPAAVAQAQGVMAELEAMVGRFDVARRLADAAVATMTELGLRVFLRRARLIRGQIDLLAGDPVGAERTFRAVYDELGVSGDLETVSTCASLLAEALLAQGRIEEAQAFTVVAASNAPHGSVLAEAKWRYIRARTRVRSGGFVEALDLAREAVEMTAQGDDLNLRADALLAQADVLLTGGRQAEAREKAAAAIALYERKGNVVAAAWAQLLASSGLDEPHEPAV
jgi:class 3 adenylate cyclase/tetratricopeptide (TPR) repeat protein